MFQTDVQFNGHVGLRSRKYDGHFVEYNNALILFSKLNEMH